MSIRTYILDDEPLALDLLEDDLSRTGLVQVIGRSGNPAEAISKINDLKPDLLISDIQMPLLTGLETIKLLTHKPVVILLTAFSNYALDGYALDVADYLLKPVPFDRLMQALAKAEQRIKASQALTTHLTESNWPKHIFVKSEYQDQKVVFKDLIYVEANRDYVKLFLKGRQGPLVSQLNLKTLEQSLDPTQFIRIHRSFIVNQDYISRVKRSELMAGETWVPIGDQYKDEVVRRLGLGG